MIIKDRVRLILEHSLGFNNTNATIVDIGVLAGSPCAELCFDDDTRNKEGRTTYFTIALELLEKYQSGK